MSKRLSILMLAVIIVLGLFSASCSSPKRQAEQPQQSAIEKAQQKKETQPAESGDTAKVRLVEPTGKSIESRFNPPEGFARPAVAADSFAHYLRNLPLKPDGSPVKYYDGRVKPAHGVHEAVIDIDTGDRDLQQCADAVIRLRAEYLYAQGRYDQIHFNFGNGFKCEYVKWAEGYRVVVSGNDARWVKTAEPSTAYREFRKYLDVVFAYAYTGSLAPEMRSVKVEDMQPGDVFIDKGHAIIVVDMAENKAAGKKVFMLAQSYMPAQDIHILANPNHESHSPWFALDFGETLRTPEWTFTNKDLRRFK